MSLELPCLQQLYCCYAWLQKRALTPKKIHIEEKRREKKEKKTKEDEKMMVFLGTRSKMRKHFVRLERSLAN